MKLDNTLSREYIIARYSYNPETGDLTSKYYRKIYRPRILRAKDSQGYIRFTMNGAAYHAHRVAWLIHFGSWPKECIDHINGDRSDNRIMNLREASRGENNHNMKINKNNTSGVKGITFHNASGKWRASIKLGGKVAYCSLFESIEEAVIAIKIKRTELHKEFTNHG